MKKILMGLILAALLLVLCSCGAEGALDSTSDKNKVMNEAFEILSKANSFEYAIYTDEQSQREGKISRSTTKTETKEIREPFARWGTYDNERTRENGEYNRTISESYQKSDSKKYEYYMRYSTSEDNTKQEPSLGDWQENIITDKEQIEITLEFGKDLREAELYLLSSNIDRFQYVEETETDGANTFRYDGFIDPSTAMEAYKTYLRDNYVLFHWVKEQKDPSLDDLKKEIASGDVVDLQSGIPQYAYAEEPVPISLWIDKETFELKKVVIDKTAMMQIYLTQELPKVNPDVEVPVVLKHIITYDIKGINTLKAIEKPE